MPVFRNFVRPTHTSGRARSTIYLGLISLAACSGSKDVSGSGAAVAGAVPKGTALALNVDAALADPVTAQYMALASTQASCKAAGEGVVSAQAQVTASITDLATLQAALTSLNSQLSTLATCVKNSGASLPAIPTLPVPPNEADVCTAVVNAGVTTKVGNCGNCKLTQTGTSLALSCGDDVAEPQAAGSLLASARAAGSSADCQVTVVNGKPTQSGTCDGCKVEQSGSSVAVRCGATASTTLPPFVLVPQFPSIPARGAAGDISVSGSCAVANINGELVKLGSCDGCAVTRSGSQLSVSCQSASAGGTGAGTPSTPAGNGGAATGGGGLATGGSSGTAGSGPCSASLVNGAFSQQGDCSKCTITRDGDSLHVVCSSSSDGGTPTPDVGGPTTGTGGCSASVVNGVLTQTGDCSKCKVQQVGNSASVSCSS